MGSPKRNRKTYEKPKEMWNLERINADKELVEKYGLKNRRELWKVQSEVRRVRRNARLLLSGESGYSDMKDKMLSRLVKIGMIASGATIDDLLDLKASNMLDRRLQTVVFKRGLAKTIKQARQLIVHGYIAMGGTRINKPGYIVDANAEPQISYYKPIDLSPVDPKAKGASAVAEPVAISEVQPVSG